MKTTILYYLLYLAGIFLSASLLSQVVLNYKLKSIEAISPLTLYLMNLTTTLYTLFVYYVPHPFSHLIAACMTQAGGYLLVFQYFYYAPSLRRMVSWLGIYGTSILAIVLCYLLWWPHLEKLGHFFGWVRLPLPFFIQLPQLYYNWKRKSMKVFSPYCVVFQVIGVVITLIACAAFQVPLQTWLNGIRALMYSGVYVLQFYWYGSEQDYDRRIKGEG